MLISNQLTKILQINSVINSGSTGRIAEEIGQLAIVNGYESYIAYARNESCSQSKKIKIGSKLDVYWHILMTRLFDRHGLASKMATKKLVRQIKIINPDIIHLHNIHGYYINYKILFDYLAKMDMLIIWTLHDCWSFTGHCPHFVFALCKKWKDVCFNCPQKRFYPASLFVDRSRKNFLEKKKIFLSIKNNLILVPVSDWLSNLCSQSFFKDVPIKRIYNGIDTNIFKPGSEVDKIEIMKEYNIGTEFLVLGVAFVWSKKKGLDDFIQLRSLLSEKYGILLVGLSEEQQKYLPQGIIGITRTESMSELSKIYSSADVYINPTFEDNFPTTNLESLACGTPVVTYNTGGCIEAITSETGYVVEPGDIQGLLKIIEEIKNKGKKSYSEACRDHAINSFKKEERYAEYLQLYDETLKKYP